MITRRTTRRHFLLRPDSDGTTQRLYWYTTAVLARKFGIEIHAVQMMSTHIHEVLTDVRGNLPAFLRERNRSFANALKAHRGWPEEVFQRAAANYVELLGPDAILKQIGYVLANCVEAGLVNAPADWPGVTVLAEEIGMRTVRVARPNIYFDPTNEVWPAVAELPIRMPAPLTELLGFRAARSRIRKAVHLAVDSARKVIRTARQALLSIAKVLCTNPMKRSRSPEVFGAREPIFATGGTPARAREAIEERKIFLHAYKRARDALKRGDLGSQFPVGSWRWQHELLPLAPQWTLTCDDEAEHTRVDKIDSTVSKPEQDLEQDSTEQDSTVSQVEHNEQNTTVSQVEQDLEWAPKPGPSRALRTASRARVDGGLVSGHPL